MHPLKPILEYNLKTNSVLHDCFFILFLLIICFITAYIGVVPTHIFGHDTVFLLDNGWRVINGQRVHIDYESAWGPLTFIIVAFGLKTAQLTANGIGFGSALYGFFIGLWSYRLGQRQLEPHYRFIVSLFLIGIVVSPYALSFGVFNSTHAMVYNRYGYALLGLILMESLPITGRKLEKNSERWFGFSSGAAIGFSLFLKISYFLAALFLIAALSVIFKHFNRSRLFGLALGFSVVAGFFLAYLSFDFLAIFDDLRNAAGARSESLTYIGLVHKLSFNIPYLIIVLLFCIAISPIKDRKWNVWKNYSVLTLVVVIFTDIMLLFTNQQRSEMPLVALYILMVCNATNFNKSLFTKSGFASTRLLMIISLFIFLPILLSQYIALGYGVIEKAKGYERKPTMHFTQPSMKDILIYEGETTSSNGDQYTKYVNDGVALLLAVTANTETVLNIDMFNPFPFALGRPPPRGGIAAAAFQYTLSENYKPSDDEFFGDADIVMVPKRPSNNNNYFYGFLKIYEPALYARYYLSNETDWWSLYRKKI